MRSFPGLKHILVRPIWNRSKYYAKVCRFYYNNMAKNFWAIKVHSGKMQQFATISSQICIMRYVQRTLLLSTLVCFQNICGPCFVGNHTKIELIHVFITTSFIISRKVHNTIEKAQNISSKSHRLDTLHILRDWRHVIYIFS